MVAGLFTWLCVQWFRLSGWVISKNLPKDLTRYVLVAGPHTSNIDFFVGVAARKEMGIHAKYLAKKELFKFPVKGLLLKLGGYPVDRSKNMSLVDSIVAIYEEKEDFAMCVAPEGTRSKVEKLKTGFYHIAMAAKVPIVLIGFDYKKKWITTSDPIIPSGDLESDLEIMFKFFKTIVPKHPENSSF